MLFVQRPPSLLHSILKSVNYGDQDRPLWLSGIWLKCVTWQGKKKSFRITITYLLWLNQVGSFESNNNGGLARRLQQHMKMIFESEWWKLSYFLLLQTTWEVIFREKCTLLTAVWRLYHLGKKLDLIRTAELSPSSWELLRVTGRYMEIKQTQIQQIVPWKGKCFSCKG